MRYPKPGAKPVNATVSSSAINVSTSADTERPVSSATSTLAIVAAISLSEGRADVARLPEQLGLAALATTGSASLALLGAEAVEYWLGSRRWEWLTFHRSGGDPDSVSDFELARYFEHL